MANTTTNKVNFAPLFKGEAFKVLEAKLKAGDLMRTHRSDKDALFVVLEGTVTFTLNNSALQLNAGQSIVIPINCPHSFVAQSEGKCQLTLDNKAKITFE